MTPSGFLEDFVQRHALENTVGIVAVSGGPDSVALAHLMIVMLQAGKLNRLILAHVNHRLRGAESDADEAFVRDLPRTWHIAADLPLTCCSTQIDVEAQAKVEQDNLEQAARTVRYDWLTDLAKKEQAKWVATGHTADDQAETVLFRLLRGSGILGMGAMHERRTLDAEISLLRPFLGLRREQIAAYLKETSLVFRIDSSNAEERFTRNRLRRDLLPHLKDQYNPAIVEVLCRLAEQARDLHDEIAEDAAQLLTRAEKPRAGNILVFSVPEMKKASSNLVREMFRLLWRREGWPLKDMDHEHWNRLVEIVHDIRPALDFPGRIEARRAGAVVQVFPKR